jgi:hypothetical protein
MLKQLSTVLVRQGPASRTREKAADRGPRLVPGRKINATPSRAS